MQGPIEKNCHFPGTYCIYSQQRALNQYYTMGRGWEGGRERNIRVLYIFSVFSVGEDHKLFSETDILFLMQPVWGAEGGAHVHFWWTQLVSQRRKNELFGSKVFFGRSNGRRMGWQIIIEYPLWQARYAIFSKLNVTAVSYYSNFTEKKTEVHKVTVAYQARANGWWSNGPWTRIKVVWLQRLSFRHHSIQFPYYTPILLVLARISLHLVRF